MFCFVVVFFCSEPTVSQKRSHTENGDTPEDLTPLRDKVSAFIDLQIEFFVTNHNTSKLLDNTSS